MRFTSDMEMDEPLLQPQAESPTFHAIPVLRSGRSSLRSTSSYSSTSSSLAFSHTKFPFASPSSSYESSSSSHGSFTTSAAPKAGGRPGVSRTRSFCHRLSTEVQGLKSKVGLAKGKGREGEQRGMGKWVKVGGEREGERLVEMVWRRTDGGQGFISPWGGVGRGRLGLE